VTWITAQHTMRSTSGLNIVKTDQSHILRGEIGIRHVMTGFKTINTHHEEVQGRIQKEWRKENPTRVPPKVPDPADLIKSHIANTLDKRGLHQMNQIGRWTNGKWSPSQPPLHPMDQGPSAQRKADERWAKIREWTGMIRIGDLVNGQISLAIPRLT
jgi:hypothetical protein